LLWGLLQGRREPRSFGRRPTTPRNEAEAYDSSKGQGDGRVNSVPPRPGHSIVSAMAEDGSRRKVPGTCSCPMLVVDREGIGRPGPTTCLGDAFAMKNHQLRRADMFDPNRCRVCATAFAGYRADPVRSGSPFIARRQTGQVSRALRVSGVRDGAGRFFSAHLPYFVRGVVAQRHARTCARSGQWSFAGRGPDHRRARRIPAPPEPFFFVWAAGGGCEWVGNSGGGTG